MNFIDLEAQYKFLKQKIDKRIQAVLNHGQYIMGPEVKELEQKLADFAGVKHVITCANGTDALTLSLIAAEVRTGDAVFCPTFSFFATAEVIAYQGATPIFIDSNPQTFNICPIDLESKIKAVISTSSLKPKAIISVDLFGQPANYPELKRISSTYGLTLIEDAAQGFGGEINGKKACSFGDIATTSFFPAKPLGCYGDGGAIFTNDDNIAELIESLRIHGKGTDKYDNVRIGMNSRLDTIQAAVLLEKLIAFPDELKRRDRLAKKYAESITEDIELPYLPPGYMSSWAQYTVKSDRRDELMKRYAEKGIPTMVYYRKCIHQQAAFKGEISFGDCPNAERLAESVLSLPMHAYLDEFNEIKKSL